WLKSRHLRQCSCKLFGGFNKSRALLRPLSGFAPEGCRLRDQSGLSVVASQQVGLVRGNVRKPALQCLTNARVECASRLAQQGAVSGIKYQRVFEQIGCVRRQTLPKQQACCNKTI